MRRSGFTLVEIAVAIAILAVILSIALPNFLKMRMVANESSIVEAMRAVVLACEDYRNYQVVGAMRGYPAGIAELTNPPAGQPPYLDRRFAAIIQGRDFKGYRFLYTSGGFRFAAVGDIGYAIRDNFALRADPMWRGVTGQRSFFVDQSGVIRYNVSGPAGSNDKALEQQ